MASMKLRPGIQAVKYVGKRDEMDVPQCRPSDFEPSDAEWLATALAERRICVPRGGNMLVARRTTRACHEYMAGNHQFGKNDYIVCIQKEHGYELLIMDQRKFQSLFELV